MHQAYHTYNNKIGIEARLLYKGNGNKPTHNDSLQLCSYTALNYKVKEQHLRVLRPKGRGVALLIEWDTLPNSWQQLCISAFGNPTAIKEQSIFEDYYRKDTEAWQYFLSWRSTKGTRLKDDQVKTYTLNASCLNTLDRVWNASASLRRNLRASIGPINMMGKKYPSSWQIAVAELNRFRELEPHTLPEHEDSLRKLLKRFKEIGYDALLSGKIGNDNSRKVTDEVVELINALFAGQEHKPTYADVVRSYDSFKSGYISVLKNDDSGECYDAADFPNISEATINQYLASWKNRVGNEHRRPNNRQMLINKYVTPHSFKQPQYAGSIISVDDRQPPFAYIDQNGNRQRVWAYMAVDLGSEAITTWVFGESKEGIILDFYKQMIRSYHSYGIPLPAEIEGEISLNSAYTNSFLKAGEMFEFTHFAANNARAKRIERYFKELRYNVEKIRQGWIARPVGMSEANSWSDIDKAPLLTKERIIQECLADIVAWNNAPHSKHKDKTRWEVFMENQHPDLRPTNYHAFLPYLGYETRSSCHMGQIRLNNKEFLLGNAHKLALGRELIQLLEQVEDEKLNLNWIDDENGNVLLAHVYQGANYVCDAVPKPIYHRAKIERGEADSEAQKQMSAYVATITKFIKDRKNAVKRVIVIDNGNKPSLAPKHVFSLPGVAKTLPANNETAEIIGAMPSEDEMVEVEGNQSGYEYDLNQTF